MPLNSAMHSGDLLYRIEQLERELFKRTGGRRLENSSIGAGGLQVKDGGSITIDGGELVLIDEFGVEVARWGEVSYGGQSSRGWVMRYPNGVQAFSMGGSRENPVIIIRDSQENEVFATDFLSRNGLSRPYLNYHMVPASEADSTTTGPMWPSTESSAYTAMWEGTNPIQHPRIRLRITTTANGGTTQWRFLVDGNVAATGSGGFYNNVNVPGWGSSINPGDVKDLVLEARQSGGGRGWVSLPACFGIRS